MKPIFIAQRDQTDCGVACLLAVIQMHGGDATLESLRKQSGTSIQGTSLLGLQQAAGQQNIEAEAFEVDDLEVFRQEASFPCILHVVIDAKLEHYVVCNGFKKSEEGALNNYVYDIIDPAKGLETWSEVELLERWKSKAVLILKPKAIFEKIEQNHNRKWLWFQELIEEDKPLLYIATGLGIGIAVLGMATAVFSQKLIDVILPNKDFNKLWVGIGVLGLLLLARGGLNFLRTFFLLRQSKDFNIRLLTDSYGKLLHLPYSFFDTRKIGEIIARLNDSRRIQGAISYLIGNVVIDCLVFIISAVFIFSYSWQIAVMALLAILLYGWLVWKYHALILAGQKDIMTHYASSESHFVDAVGGISAIKTNNKESFFHQIGNTVYTFFQEKIYALGTLSNRYSLWSEVFNAFLISLILAYSSYLVLQNQLQLGEMMAVLSIALGMIGSIARLAFTNIQIQEARVAFDRMFEFAGMKPETETEHAEMITKLDAVNSISLKNISFRFAGKKTLFDNVNLELHKGKISVLMGEVGSGKTVLINILQKFKEWENGEVLVNGGMHLSAIPNKLWRSKIGVVSQEAKIFSGTLLDNIALGNFLEEAEKVVDFCRKYGFDKYFESLPQDYLTIVGEEGVNLSGGQKQLVNLARALYQNPEILLLDEPTSAMDFQTEQFVLELLKSFKNEKIILMVSHRITYEEFADEVIHMELGRFKERAKLF